MAALHVVRLRRHDPQRPPADRFAGQHLLDVVPEGGIDEDADAEGRRRVAEGRLRPLDELGEIVEEGGFYRLLTRLRRLASQDVRGDERQQAAEKYAARSRPDEGQKRHAERAYAPRWNS